MSEKYPRCDPNYLGLSAPITLPPTPTHKSPKFFRQFRHLLSQVCNLEGAEKLNPIQFFNLTLRRLPFIVANTSLVCTETGIGKI
jgi:hypothetical protein